MKILKLTGSAVLVILSLWGLYNGLQQGFSSENGPALILFSILGIMAGIGILIPELLANRPETDQASASSTTTVSEQMQEDSPPVDEGRQKVQFIITRNHSDEGLSAVESLLKEDKRVLSMGRDEGRHYSVPDGDDLPEWFSIHASCKKKDLKDLMADLESQIKATLSKDTANAMEIRSL